MRNRKEGKFQPSNVCPQRKLGDFRGSKFSRDREPSSSLVITRLLSHLYSREKRVSSVLLWIHLNSRGQLPSAMQVSTSLLRSRCS